MALRTAFTELVGVAHPIVQAPMGGTAGGALAAAVSNAGGLGMIGAAQGNREFLEREIGIVTQATERPWGIGFLSWCATVEAVEAAVAHRPSVVMLSFGDPVALARPVADAGLPLVVQVTDLDEARQAVELGAAVVVAQGAEAGGHGGRRSTLPFVPVVVDLVAPTPVLAAGGIADGRGIAAAVALGAVGALVGTRFQASLESLAQPEIVKAIVSGRGEDTERSRVLDVARGTPWPERYSARTLRNEWTDRWQGREAELASDAEARAEYRQAIERHDPSAVPVWASEAIDLITDALPAGEIVAQLAAEAEAALREAAGAIVPPDAS